MNDAIYLKLNKPPVEALKKIKGGRLSGMTDIKPQWRYRALTEVFGPCGVGWKFEVVNMWTEQGSDNQLMCFAHINFYHSGPEWSAAIPGIGGSTLVAKETKMMHSSDEAFKMAITDALSTATKMIGVGAAIYEGQWDGSKYKDAPPPEKKPTPQPAKITYAELKASVDKQATDTASLAAWRKDHTKDCLALDKGEQIQMKSHLSGLAAIFAGGK